MRRLAAAVVALACLPAGAHGQEAEQEPGPDLEFLEYLGAWAEEDDEWLAIEEWQRDNGAEADEEAEAPEKSERDDDDESE